ncbi:aconitase family protein [Orrella marina]|uniref:3-isopropylmalate dehydratase n=1 Tax=Orrella marina TaxID=2163011 RepID=A0A2R4XKU2_9BURK|nr:aconitase family protein [Orrella marina]AWB34428.1 3-isopropylmalate dehydratase [Orrella marina]
MPNILFDTPVPILFLTCLAQQVASQINGQRLSLSDVGKLRDDISTDEITPVPVLTHFDETLGRFPYTGLTLEGERPIEVDAIRHGGFKVVVAGRRYGKGSSREHSPMAERAAGVRLVIAESFERIYRQNADNIGLYTSTDMGLVQRIQRGEAVTVEELVADRDALSATIILAGGLLPFGQRYLAPDVLDMPESSPRSEGVGQTLFQKIVARQRLHPAGLAGPGMSSLPDGTPVGQGLFVRAHWRFIHEYYTGMAASLLKTHLDEKVRLVDAQQIVVFEDHTSYVEESPNHLRAGIVPNVVRMCEAQRAFVATHGLREHRTLTEAQAASDTGQNVAGISHAMMAEHYALPGQVVVGTDSHTPHSGALGCVAFGVGTTDMANAFVTGVVRLTMPGSIRVELSGRLAPGVTAKDVALHLLALPQIREGLGVGKVFEFCGESLRHLSVDERATLTNMVAELGGLTGLVAPDDRTVDFLLERRGVRFTVEPWMQSDPGAVYDAYLEVDCTALAPMVAAPGDPGNGSRIDHIRERPRVDIAYGGSCTAGKREDFDHYHEVLAWALEHGMRVPEHVSLLLQYGTTAVRDHCVSRGYEQTFRAMGARILQPSCGACANCGPGSSTDAAQVTVSTINRNFPGRSGPGQVWLASAPTVMASAVAGELVSFDELRARQDS